MSAVPDQRISAALAAANALIAQGRQVDAIQGLFQGIKHHPQDVRIRSALAAALEGFPLDSAGEAVRGVLLDLCRDDNIATQLLADAIIGVTRASADITREPLLIALLCRAVINDPDLERALTQLRRAMLLNSDTASAVPFDFACALARQCFNTEYAFFVEEDEIAALQQLRERTDASEESMVLTAMYAPLNRLPGWERLLERAPGSFSEAFRPIWREQVVHFQRERDIARSIESLTPITNDTSQAVRGQYEASPYPRWLTVQRPQRGSPAPQSILIAGCGTGQHPIHVALESPESDIVAVDLSRASLAYAVRMAERFAVKNLSFRQADILELGSWSRKFDRIESLGVLHHMKDPLAGWRVLTGLIEDRGTMRIGLYSTLARQPLQAARELIKAAGHPGTPEGIRLARRAILDLPADHPARSVAYSDDFYSASGFRDLLMHVQEHAFTLPRVAECLKQLGLEFLGFQAHPAVTAAFQAAHRDPAALTDLNTWDRFETLHPEVFRGMYFFSCRRRI